MEYKQKQIEDMVKELAKDMGIAFQLANTTRFGVIAGDLIEIGYRKIPKGSVVLSYREYVANNFGYYLQGREIGIDDISKGRGIAVKTNPKCVLDFENEIRRFFQCYG